MVPGIELSKHLFEVQALYLYVSVLFVVFVS